MIGRRKTVRTLEGKNLSGIVSVDYRAPGTNSRNDEGQRNYFLVTDDGKEVQFSVNGRFRVTSDHSPILVEHHRYKFPRQTA